MWITMNNFQLDHELHGKIEVVRITGSLDVETFLQLERFLNTLFHLQHFNVLLDCKDLIYIASSGLGALVGLTKLAREVVVISNWSMCLSGSTRSSTYLGSPRYFRFTTRKKKHLPVSPCVDGAAMQESDTGVASKQQQETLATYADCMTEIELVN